MMSVILIIMKTTRWNKKGDQGGRLVKKQGQLAELRGTPQARYELN